MKKIHTAVIVSAIFTAAGGTRFSPSPVDLVLYSVITLVVLIPVNYVIAHKAPSTHSAMLWTALLNLVCLAGTLFTCEAAGRIFG